MMIAGRVRLKPTVEQEERFLKFCNTARFVYNETLAYRLKVYEKEKRTAGVQECIEHIQYLKYHIEKFKWIQNTPESVSKQAIRDLDRAYSKWLGGSANKPKMKCKNDIEPSFYQRTDNFRVLNDGYIKISGIKEPVKKNKEEVPEKICNIRVKYDGKYWYLTYSYEKEEKCNSNNEKIVGIDLGIKELAVTSDGQYYKNINKSNQIKQLIKRRNQLKKQINNKYQLNGNIKSKNIEKLEKQIILINRKISNISNNHIHKMTKEVVESADTLVIEDLDIKKMIKHTYLGPALKKQKLGKVRKYITYKSRLDGKEVIVADRYFPSSQLCSCCGNRKSDLTLNVRTYVCDECGLVIDRDLNAAINLAKYPFIQQIS